MDTSIELMTVLGVVFQLTLLFAKPTYSLRKHRHNEDGGFVAGYVKAVKGKSCLRFEKALYRKLQA